MSSLVILAAAFFRYRVEKQANTQTPDPATAFDVGNDVSCTWLTRRHSCPTEQKTAEPSAVGRP